MYFKKSFLIKSAIIVLTHTAIKTRFRHSQKWNCAASLPIPTFLYLWAIQIYTRTVNLFSCSQIDGLIVGIYKSLTDTVHECRIWERDCTVPVNRKSVDTLPLTCAEPAHLAQVTPWEGASPAGWGWGGWGAPAPHLASCHLKHFPIKKDSKPLFIVIPNAFFYLETEYFLNMGFGPKCK
jgi:hypothetical protein